MISFNVGALKDWRPVGAGIGFRVDDGAFRRVSFDILAEEETAVFAGNQLVASGTGLFQVTFSTEDDVQITTASVNNSAVWYRLRDGSPYLPATDEPSFTRIEPRERNVHNEVQRAVNVMRLNAQKREAELSLALDDMHLRMQELAAKLDAPAKMPVLPKGDKKDEDSV